MVYLKAIEAHGFKSFADKVNIRFDAGVTAVVGPNGSGKSNITDAIRWVLGEQSARSIRGVKMEDVIFNGTTDRKPMNHAYVRLELDNTARTLQMDADAVHITRKLYRNGDSEYFINNEKSRLKEINELFLDSGLGRNAFNIISQGEVDEVLNAKPDQRRSLIEEAAGVMKYKLRKKESEKRLEDTAANLDRVHDIIHELESRVQRLERESANAKEYLALKEEMRQSDIEVTVHDVDALLATLETEAQSLASAEQSIAADRETLADIEARMNRLAEKRDDHDRKNRTLNARLVDLSKKLEQTNGQIALYKERKDNKGQASEDLKVRLETSTERHDSLHQQHAEVLETLDELERTSENLEQAIKEARKERQELMKDHSGEIEQLKDQYYDLMVQKTTLENEHRRAEDEKSRLGDSIRQKQERLESLKSTLEEEKARHLTLEQQYEATRSILSEKREAFQEANTRMAALQSQYDKEREKLDTARRYIDQQSSKLEMLTTMQNEYRGYYPGARFILKNRKQSDGIIGSVGELLSTDGEYVRALDTALGAQAQNIVTTDEHSAKLAIRRLKEAKAGFATFLPMDIIRHKHIHSDIRNTIVRSSIDVQIMSEIVHYTADIPNVVSHLLGTTLVTRSMDDATKLAGEIGHKLRIVTVDGETIMPGGAMSGGSKSSKSSIIESQREHQETKEKLEEYQEKTQHMAKSVTRLGEDLADQMVLKDKLEAEGREIAEQNETDHAEIRRLTYQIEAKEENAAILEEELKAIDAPLDSRDHAEQIRAVDADLEALDVRIRRMSASDQDKKETLRQLTDEGHSMERELATVSERLTHSRNEARRLEAELADALSAVRDITARQKMLEQDIGTLDIEALEAQRETLNQQVSELYEATEEAASLQHEMKQEYASLQESKDDHLKRLDSLQDALRKHSGTKEKLDVQIEQKIEYLSETYKMTYDRAREEYQDFTNIDQKRMKISLNRKSIEELGPVNLGAIEEFERVNERYLFLKAQESDLYEARQTLLEVIEEMDEAVAVRFQSAYDQVNQHFGEVFRRMFGGGQAELRLTEPGNYLESGVEIYAQPPGKKLSTLSLLSGGERALTAISLLFGILKVRVSPFIILDEVEAALDEANVLRYAHYLKQLSQDTQFIVITHRKGTMEESDRLFGVTMQERGVSQLISVDLKDYEENTREEETV
ncbi:chromosome segregation protein SMC [Salinicoccus hispanicus]|uniref:Chromosome partition protein Smc n=1 Tax=Salinicoccus hispanicus TaxID=157225 RepID=A0A6N8TXZ8_9STAP|nr:chromosome segregation protein SMC [Salinicoccus hispanicus]MXQ49857.1 chromosome segregation protein SMC [Salinicoccus hispanicus]